MSWFETVEEKAKCCSCEGSMAESLHSNLIILKKIATWERPNCSNVMIQDCPNQAVSVVCDNCLKNKKMEVKYAIELSDGVEQIRYHPIQELRDLPDEILKAYEQLEKKMFKPNPIMN